jgi:hypothetical protein
MRTESGDIALFTNPGVAVAQGLAQFFKYVSVAPLLLSLGRNGGEKGAGMWNAGYGHAGVYTHTGELAHSGAAGTVLELFNAEPAALFRLGAPQPLRRRAGDVAARWATGESGSWKLSKAVASAFGSSSYGSGAKRRAAFYRAHGNTPGGPPSSDGEGKKGWYCSMFAIACWQAVLDEVTTERYLKLDARYATPMTLTTYLENNPAWTRIA